MADFDTAARQEAERRYPAPEADADRLTYPREALRDGKRRAFEAGARWGASPLNMTTLRATFARAERAEAALAEVAALHTNVYHRKMYAEFWACGECDYPATGPDDYCPTATLARAERIGADR